MEFADRTGVMERLRTQQRINEALAKQIEEKEAAILREREKALETRKKVDESLRRLRERRELELERKRLEEIKEGQREIQKTLKQHELRKNAEQLAKEREREQLISSYKDFEQESHLNEVKRAEQLKDLANDLKQQMERRAHENEKAREQESLQTKQQQAALDLCPHGKRYICAQCHRSYPRTYLSKRPLKH